MEKQQIPARRVDWRARLTAYLADAAARPFRPGTHDCALFVAGAIHAMTGHDAAADWRGSYGTLKAGRAALVEAGHADHVALVAATLPEIAPAFAQVGDVACLPGGRSGGALGVVQGAGVYCLRPSGLAIVSRLEIERAFSL